MSMFLPYGLQKAKPSCPSLSPGICPSSCPLNLWCHPTISSFAAHFSCCLEFFPASGSFPMSWLVSSTGQSTGAWASILPKNIQGCLPLGSTDLISLLSKGLSRVFSSTTVQKHHFGGGEAWLLFWQIFKLFPYAGYSKQYLSERGGADIFLN